MEKVDLIRKFSIFSKIRLTNLHHILLYQQHNLHLLCLHTFNFLPFVFYFLVSCLFLKPFHLFLFFYVLCCYFESLLSIFNCISTLVTEGWGSESGEKDEGILFLENEKNLANLKPCCCGEIFRNQIHEFMVNY